MIFLQLWWALMVFSGSGSSQEVSTADEKHPVEGSDKLLSFSRAVEQARPELQELKASYGGLQEQDNQRQQSRDRRNSIDDMLASFAQVPVGESKSASADEERVLQEAADAWFRDIQASMSKGSANQKRSGSKQERSVGKDVIDQHTKAMQRTEIGKVKLKYKDTPDDTIIRKFQVTKAPTHPQEPGLTHLDIKLKQVQQMLTDHESLEAQKQEKSKDVRKKVEESRWVDKLPEFGDNPIPDGIYESTLNRLAFPHATANKLAHEANYKLSKIEQEASEKATKYSKPGSISEAPLKQLKRSSCSGFNPMNEIKLKTSSRLMLKGLGPSLPSNALIDIHRNQMVDSMLRRRELEEQEQQKFEASQNSDEEDQPMGINGIMTQNENLDYLQPNNPVMEANPMMELPQSYDYRVPQYDRFHPLSQRQMTNVRDYERSNRMPLDLDRFKREPQDDSVLDTLSLDEQELPLKAEDQNVSDHEMAIKLGILDIKEGKAIHSLKEHESGEKASDEEVKLEDLHDEVKLEEDALSKAESKLDAEVSSMEGKMEDKSEVEVESKLLGPVKRETKNKKKLIGATLNDDSQPATEVRSKAESPSKRDVSLNLDASSELHSKLDATLSPNSERQDTLGKCERPETPDSPDKHDSNPDSDTECKSEEVEKAEADAEKDNGIVKVNIKLKLQEPAEEKSECEDTDKLEPKEAAASVPKVNPDAVVKLLANELSLDKDRGKRQTRPRRFRRQNRRSKRSVEDSEQDVRQQQEDHQSRGGQHSVAKRLVHLLDDFEDHNGNRVAFGTLGNGMLTPDAEDLGGKSYPGHETLAHYEDLEATQDGDSLANIYDPTKDVVPMMNQRPNIPFQAQQQPFQYPQQQQQPVQQQQQQPLQQNPQQQDQIQQQQDLNRQRHQSSNFQASFNLTHFFNELQKLQNIKTPQQQPQQQQSLPVHQQYVPQHQPLLLPQQQLPMQRNNQQLPIKPVSPPIKSFGVHRYFGPFFNKQLKNDPYLAALGTSTTIDPRCVSITPTVSPPPALNATTGATLPPNCTTPSSSPNPGTTTPPPAAPSHTENVCNAPDALKLNVSINANVCGDPKTKQFYGNGSISLLPAYSRLRTASNSDLQDVQLQGNDAQVEHDLDDLGVRDERRIREAGDESKNNRDDDAKPKNEEKPRKQEGHIKRPSIKWSKKNQSKETSQQAPRVKPKVTPSLAPKEVPKGTSEEEHKTAAKCHRPRIDTPETRSDSYDKLITGKMSEDIVSAVFEAVGNDPGMDRLLAVLERNRKCAQKQPKNFYQIRNDKTENYLHQTESMVRDTMEAISNIIDQQVRRRACIPLRPDLQEFYDLILKTSNEEQKCREKRQSSLRVLAEDFSQDVRLLDPSKINQKSRIVKKLLRQYEDLPMEDQQAAVGVRDELLLDLVYLRKMADSAERHQRNARLQEVLKQTSLDEVLEKRMSSEYSPRFIKLLKTAELFKEAGEQQARAFVGL
ncbi:uncharacterized protein LOC119550985 isoform X1 [Drosophila subpulchrella]|uniref:uncharacterized protein LOC119550985 isoform X1 n=1 Tax=Drosophila subpulchrella TaxID=1486046 RepID=UPI0018A17F09|nr:uncharacterized protein LOC119550985 isoform X1 [Drosophila subpulchrella]